MAGPIANPNTSAAQNILHDYKFGIPERYFLDEFETDDPLLNVQKLCRVPDSTNIKFKIVNNFFPPP